MAITSLTSSRSVSTILLTATSDQSSPSYRWWVDGLHVATTTAGTLELSVSGQARVDCYDDATEPGTLPARRVVWFTRGGGDVARVRLEQSDDGGSTWSELAEFGAGSSWSWEITTPRLDDLTSYLWRAVPVDAAGNDGTAREGLSELVLRTPDAPTWSMSYSAGTNRVTFA